MRPDADDGANAELINGEKWLTRMWMAAAACCGFCMLSIGSLALQWVSMQATLSTQASAKEVAELRGALEAKADAADLQKLIGQLDAKASKSMQDVLAERTAKNMEDIRELRTKIDEMWAWVLTAYKSFATTKTEKPDE